MRTSIMTNNSLFFTLFSYATTIFARPWQGGLRYRLMSPPTRSGQTAQLTAPLENFLAAANNSSTEVLSTNWAGAAIRQPPSNKNFNAVSGRFIVPTPSVPVNSTGVYAASIWVGMDGYTDDARLLHVGVDLFTQMLLNGSTLTSYMAWYQWIPGPSEYIPSTLFSLSAGDVITIDIASTGPTASGICLTNESTAQRVNKTLQAPSNSSTLIGQNVEWIIENFMLGGTKSQLADFGITRFDNCEADTGHGVVGLNTSDVVILVDKEGKIVSNTAIVDEYMVHISYVRAGNSAKLSPAMPAKTRS